ncbi:hypothetical protein LTR53_001686 [Teratosphaeriaceae sp. CCFEE 6253]|nr:hypothetical protein LTR53_001686 [Teratosphaeriaceae sp. CCFEE 6253]
MVGRRRVRVLLGVLVFVVVAVVYLRKSDVREYGQYVTERVVGGGSVLRPKPGGDEAERKQLGRVTGSTARSYAPIGVLPTSYGKYAEASTSSVDQAAPVTAATGHADATSSTTAWQTSTPTQEASGQLPAITEDDELPYEIGEGRVDNEVVFTSASSAIHWTKQPEQFPISTTAQLPTGTSSPIPRIQFTGTKAMKADPDRLAIIKQAAEHAWSGYREAAFGMDEVKPISGGHNNPFNGWGATLVDSLDTLWIMGMTDEFEEALEHVKTIDFTTSIRSDIPLFETTIRYLGGLIGAYDISGAEYGVLLDKAVELAEVLYSAFDTPNRMPQTYYRWKPAFASQPHRASARVVMAELGSLSLEFTRLAQLTGEPKYYDAIARITDAFEIWQNETRVSGLWPTTVDASGCAKPAMAGSFSATHANTAHQQLVPGGEGGLMQAGAPVKGAAGANIVHAIDINVDTKQHAAAQAKLDEQIAAGKHGAAVKRQLEGAPSHDNPSHDASQYNATQHHDPKVLYAGAGGVHDTCIPQNLTSISRRGLETFTLGGQADSTYEYLPKMHLLLNGRASQYESMYISAVEATKQNLLFRPMVPEEDRELLMSGTLRVQYNTTTGQYQRTLVPETEHLTCFAGGMLALGGRVFGRNEDVEIGRRLTEGCVWAYESTATGIMPEVFKALACEGGLGLEEGAACKWNQTAYWRELDPWEETRTKVHKAVSIAAATGSGPVETRTDDGEPKTAATDDWRAEATSTTASFDAARALQTAATVGDIGLDNVDDDSSEAKHVVQKIATSETEFEDLAIDLHAAANLGKRQLNEAVPAVSTASAIAPGPEASITPTASPAATGISISGSTASRRLSTASAPIYTPKPPLSHADYVAQKILDERLPPGMTKLRDRRYILRPEAIESVFYLYRITADQHWRDVGWRMFLAIDEYTRAQYGNAAIDDVTKSAPELKDTMESFWLAETLKYFWLLFSDADVGSLDDWVLNTEAHFLKRSA